MRKVTGSPTAPVAITPRPRTLGLASVADRESFACRSLSACLSKFPVKNWAETGGTREVQTARAEPTRKLSHTPRRQAERRRDRTRAHILNLGGQTDGANAVPGKKNLILEVDTARTKRTNRKTSVLFKIIEVAFTSEACSLTNKCQARANLVTTAGRCSSLRRCSCTAAAAAAHRPSPAAAAPPLRQRRKVWISTAWSDQDEATAVHRAGT